MNIKLDDQGKKVKEKDSLLEKKVEENCNLKLSMDDQRQELNKLKKNLEHA